MANQPAAWKRVKFDEVVRQVKARVDPERAGIERYVAGEHMSTDDLRIRRWGEVGDGYLGPAFHMHFRPGQVLYGSRRTYLRKVAIADFEGICANTTFVLEPADPSKLLPEFLPFVMQTDSFHEHSKRESKGSVNPYVNFSDLAWYEFALPPLEEQRRLAELLRAANDTVECSRAVVRATHAARLALREWLINQSVSPTKAVGELCEMQNGRPFPSSDYGKSGVRLLRPANLAPDGRIDWRPERTVSMPDAYLETAAGHVVSRGDVVINLTAQSLDDGFMGRVCFVRGQEKSFLNQRIGRFVRFQDGVIPEYLFRVLQGARFQAHAIAMCEGTKVKHMFWRHIEIFRIALPPKDQQRRACEQMLAMDVAFDSAAKRSEEAGRLASDVVNRTLVREAV